LRPLELELALALIRLDAIEREEEIGLPRGTAIFAVGDGLEADVLLATDELDDLLVLDRGEHVVPYLAALMLAAHLAERPGAQQTADMIGAERGLRAEHWDQESIISDQ
jgi:hypothetical protein